MELIKPIENKEFAAITHTFLYKGYYIEVVNTVMGARRVCIREPDNLYYDHNFCAGYMKPDCYKLVGLAKALIDLEIVSEFPFCSEIKPYYLDKDFVQKMNSIEYEPYEFNL